MSHLCDHHGSDYRDIEAHSVSNYVVKNEHYRCLCVVNLRATAGYSLSRMYVVLTIFVAET